MISMAPKQPHNPLSMAVKPEPKSSARPFGLASPWKITPGNPEYPNHHPFLTHLGVPRDLQEAKTK